MDNEFISGADDLDRFFETFGAAAREEAATLLYGRGESIMLDSKQNYVPVDQGTLQDTGHVELPVIDGDTISVRLAFGGPSADYAEAVHEHLSEHSPPSWQRAEAMGQGVHFSQGGPKYLETPFAIGTHDLDQYIADGLRAKLGT